MGSKVKSMNLTPTSRYTARIISHTTHWDDVTVSDVSLRSMLSPSCFATNWQGDGSWASYKQWRRETNLDLRETYFGLQWSFQQNLTWKGEGSPGRQLSVLIPYITIIKIIFITKDVHTRKLTYSVCKMQTARGSQLKTNSHTHITKAYKIRPWRSLPDHTVVTWHRIETNECFCVRH